MEHAVFQKVVKPKTFAAWHGIPEENISQEHKVFLAAYHKERNNTRPCQQPVCRKEAERLAWLGEPGAITWCKFAGYLPLDFDHNVKQPDVVDLEEKAIGFDQVEAARRHVIALCCSAMGADTAKTAL